MKSALGLVIIIIIAKMAVFNVAGYLIEERRRWPVTTADEFTSIPESLLMMRCLSKKQHFTSDWQCDTGTGAVTTDFP